MRRAAHSAAASLVPRRAASHTVEADDGSPQETAMLALLLSCCVLLQPKPVTHTGDCSVAMSRSKGRERKHAHSRPATGLRRRRAPSFSKQEERGPQASRTRYAETSTHSQPASRHLDNEICRNADGFELGSHTTDPHRKRRLRHSQRVRLGHMRNAFDDIE